MTDDQIDAVIDAYIDHLEMGSPAPSLEDLSPGDRQLVEDIIRSIETGKGINPFLSRPSFSALVANTDLVVAATPSANLGLTIDTVRAEVVSALGSASTPVVDGTAQNEGIASDALVQFQALHIRLQYRDDIMSAEELGRVDPQIAAGAVFGRFPETAALVLVIGDTDLSSVAIDPFDTEPFIGTPDGQTYPPRLTRPVLSLHDTLRRLVDELAPNLSVVEDADGQEPPELLEVIRRECVAACGAVRVDGTKSRTAAKKETWSDFDQLQFLTKLVTDAASNPMTETEMNERLKEVLAA